jgi:alpha-1,6-mannosyltransferase
VKIVDVSGFYSQSGGGVRSYVHQKLEAAARLGHDVTIIAPGARDRVEQRNGGKIVWVRAPLMPFDANYRMFWSSKAAVRVLDQEQPDVVEGSSTWRGGWIAGRWSGAALKSLVFHQDFVAAYAHTLLDARLSHPAIDRLFAPTWRYVARLSRHFDVTIAGGEWLAARLVSTIPSPCRLVSRAGDFPPICVMRSCGARCSRAAASRPTARSRSRSAGFTQRSGTG